MARVRFPYTKIALRPVGGSPARTAHRPMLNVTLTADNGQYCEALALADSGADACLFPLRFVAYLGLDITTLPSGMTSGVGSAANATYYASCTVDLGSGLRFQTVMGFTEGMDRAGFGLLGQQGFFENFDVEFLYKSGDFTVTPSCVSV